MNRTLLIYVVAATAFVTCCPGCTKQTEMGTYASDRVFLSAHGIETLELCSTDGQSKVLLAPSLQGRVMTSTTEGDGGTSYGWINRSFIEEGKVNPQFNPYGG